MNLGLSCCLSLWAAFGGDNALGPFPTDGWDDPALAAEADDASAAPDREALAAQIAEIVERTGAPGAAVAVVDSAGVWVRGFGLAGLDGRAMTPETLFRVGSLTKPFITLAILRLVQAGRLRLEDRVRDLLPELAMRNRWERTDPVRVAHLLEHTSGFDEMRFNEIFDPQGRQDRPLREVLAHNPNSRVVRWRPGSGFAYSQPGYTVAAAIIEKVSGLAYERFLQEQVFGPLGVEGAALRLEGATRTRLATGHHRRQRVEQVMLLHRPAGNLMISAAGVARLIQLQLGRGQVDGRRFLAAEHILRMERCGTMPHAPAASCYGMGNWGDVGGPLPLRGHGGFMPGYFVNYRYSPQRGFGYVVMVNDTGVGIALRQISKAILRAELAGAPPPRPPKLPTPGDLGRYTGYYRLASPGVEFLRFLSDVYEGVTIREQGGNLFMDLPEVGGIPLVATGPDLFRTPRDCDSSARFSVSPQGRRVLVLHSVAFEEQNAIWAAARRWLLEGSLLLLRTTVVVPLFLLLLGDREKRRLLLRPLLAALSLSGMASAFDYAQEQNLLGVACAPTLTVWILSWLFALAAHTGLQRAVRSMRSVEVSLAVRTYALLVSAAAVWVALHLSHYGLIGLRTWRW
jgi:CubicO group peptidase (beta-lactamase class C family)